MRVRDWFNCGMVNKAESSSFKIPQTAGLQSDTFLTFSGVVRVVEGWRRQEAQEGDGHSGQQRCVSLCYNHCEHSHLTGTPNTLVTRQLFKLSLCS